MVLQESIRFRSLPGVAGIEILDMENTSRHWKWLNTAFACALNFGWHGEVRYRRRQRPFEPGLVFCSAPGEVHSTPRVRRPGTVHGLLIDAEVFEAYVAEHGVRRQQAEWTEIVQRVSPTFRERMATVLGFLPLEDTEMRIQSGVVSLFESFAQELVAPGVLRRERAPGPRLAQQIRECLHSTEGTAVDLDSLAARFEISRFQVLRTFRAYYGIPPHAYQLCSRVARARTLLKAGHTPAEVASRCGFADQSHLGRHFKRLIGVTPMQYAQACDAAVQSKHRGRLEGVSTHFSDVRSR
jgi:AraC-like DNA-binding protein